MDTNRLEGENHFSMLTIGLDNRIFLQEIVSIGQCREECLTCDLIQKIKASKMLPGLFFYLWISGDEVTKDLGRQIHRCPQTIVVIGTFDTGLWIGPRRHLTARDESILHMSIGVIDQILEMFRFSL